MPQNPLRNAVFRLFGSRAPRAGVVSAGVLSLWTTLILGCAGAEKRNDPEVMRGYAAQAEGVFADEPRGRIDGPVEPGWWSVLVATVPTGRMDDAERMLTSVQAAGLPEAYIAVRDKRPVISYGRYEDPADPDAQAGLRRVRQTTVGEVNPFGSAMLIPPVADRTASDGDEANLRTVRQRFTRRDAAYTLQIGAYGRPDLSRPTEEELRLFRREAEQAVRQLRAQGETAFYYHGPNMSMVTIGVFSEDDHDGSTQPPIETIRLRQIRQKYPHNLLNGEGIMETVRTETGSVRRLQASRLVAIPER